MGIELYNCVSNNNRNLFLFETNGFSMWPFLKSGEKIVIKKVSIENLIRGNIILYQKDNRIICHRLIKKIRDKHNWLLYVRGDSSSSSEFITTQMFLGKGIGILRNKQFINLDTKIQKFLSKLIVIIAPCFSKIVRWVNQAKIKIKKRYLAGF